jgi:hypothetical protein
MVSSRLALPESLAEQLLSQAASAPAVRAAAPAHGAREDSAAAGATGPGPDGADGSGHANGGSRASAVGLSRREQTERAFLALCIAAPHEGAVALEGLDLDEHFSSELLRRAARHLRECDLAEPIAGTVGGVGGVDGDSELERLLAELIVEAGRDQANPAMLDVQRLQLELARIDRQIQQARGRERGDVNELAQHRATLKREFDRAYGQVLEQTGDREG